MEDIQIEINRIGIYNDMVLLRIGGFIDTSTAPELKKKIINLINEGFVQLVIDLSRVQYVSSAGWGVFVGEIKNVRENGGDIKVAKMAPSVFEVFEMLEFNLILKHYESVREALYDFDFARGVNLELIKNILDGVNVSSNTKAEKKKSEPQIQPETQVDVIDEEPPDEPAPEQPASHVSLPDVIKEIVLENPMLGAWTITKKIKQYGKKAGYWEVRAMLKTLGLDTKARRKRYYRSR